MMLGQMSFHGGQCNFVYTIQCNKKQFQVDCRNKCKQKKMRWYMIEISERESEREQASKGERESSINQ